METNTGFLKLENVKQKMNFEWCFVVEPIGRKGDLAMVWKCEEQVRVINYSQGHIMVQIVDDNQKVVWTLTVFLVTSKQVNDINHF